MSVLIAPLISVGASFSSGDEEASLVYGETRRLLARGVVWSVFHRALQERVQGATIANLQAIISLVLPSPGPTCA